MIKVILCQNSFIRFFTIRFLFKIGIDCKKLQSHAFERSAPCLFAFDSIGISPTRPKKLLPLL